MSLCDRASDLTEVVTVLSHKPGGQLRVVVIVRAGGPGLLATNRARGGGATSQTPLYLGSLYNYVRLINKIHNRHNLGKA